MLLFGAMTAAAQEAQVRVSSHPYYAGVPIDIQVIVDGFDRDPEPAIDIPPVEGAIVKFVGISPNVSSSIQIINGQMTRSERVRFIYRYRVIAERPGHLEIGPFGFEQGAKTARADAVRFDIQAVPTSDEQRFRLVLPEGPLSVGQRLTVTLEWWLSEAFAQRLAGRRARVPLFDLVDRFTFEDVAMPGTKSMLLVETAAGTLELPAAVRNATWHGEPYLVVTAQRTMIALKPGEVVIAPSSIITEEATRWSTDFFGNRVPSGVRRMRVADEARALVFKSPPADGRPAGFSGAVGKGFSIEVSADRSVVQTGDPIRLTINIRGDAALNTISLPDLAASGLDARDFKVPEGPLAGIVEDGVKRFDVVVRVNNDEVTEIPPIAWSWFNPDLSRYETTESRPIAMSVRAATVVSAADVVTSTAVAADAATDTRTTADTAPRAGRRAKPAFTLSGAELSIEMRPTALLQNPHPWFASPAMLLALYFAGLSTLGLAIAARRRARLDPQVRAQRQTLETERRAVAQATNVADIAHALRRMAAASSPMPRDAYDALLVECDNLAYAPSATSDTPVDVGLRARALAVADAILETTR